MKKTAFVWIVFLLMHAATIQAQSLSVQDHSSLADLVKRWNLYTDAPSLAKLPDYMALWTGKSPVLTNPFGKFTGLDAIQTWQKGYNVPNGPAFGKRHVSDNIVAEATGKDMATVSFYLFLYEVNEIPAVFATSASTVTAVKENGVWKIQTYTIALDPGFGKLMEKMKKG